MGAGDFADVLHLSEPGMRELANRHGYVLRVVEPVAGLTAQWSKIPRLREALDAHERVLWLDADVLVHDAGDDPLAVFDDDPRQWLALAYDGRIGINTGVWGMRAGPSARRLLDEMLQRLPQHPGAEHEQGALTTMLGYSPGTTASWLSAKDVAVLPDRFGGLDVGGELALEHVGAGQTTGAEKLVLMAAALRARQRTAS